MASVRKRGNTYQITVSNGRDKQGRQILETKTFKADPEWSDKKTQKELLKVMHEFEAQVKGGSLYKGGRMPFEEFVEKWFSEYVEKNLAEQTQIKYKEVLEGYLLPEFGRLKLMDVNTFRLQAYFNKFFGEDNRYNLKHSSIQKIHTVVRSIFKKAYQWQVIKENPMDRVYLPNAEADDYAVSCFNEEQTKIFLEFIDKPYTITVPAHLYSDAEHGEREISEYTHEKQMPLQMRLLFNVAIFGGLRRGEILALTWDDVDFERGEISVNKSAYSVKGELKTKAPKTKGSKRTVAMPDTVMDLFARHKQEQSITAERLGGYWLDENWVFTQDNGKRMHDSTPYHAFKRTIDRYNKLHEEDGCALPNIPFHGLRHTTASILLANNVDLVTVAARLGHSQTSTTLDTYAHALQSSNKSTAIALENLLGK